MKTDPVNPSSRRIKSSNFIWSPASPIPPALPILPSEIKRLKQIVYFSIFLFYFVLFFDLIYSFLSIHWFICCFFLLSLSLFLFVFFRVFDRFRSHLGYCRTRRITTRNSASNIAAPSLWRENPSPWRFTTSTAPNPFPPPSERPLLLHSHFNSLISPPPHPLPPSFPRNDVLFTQPLDSSSFPPRIFWFVSISSPFSLIL